ncbi:MAG: DUF1330 domain-containing protein [Rhodobacteraceae bacterium]|nr:DUF1330 domain-containing protein [Paracoccaceae bacterium]
MPKAYWIVRVSVKDEARYPDYLQAAAPACYDSPAYSAARCIRQAAADAELVIVEGAEAA